MVHLVFVWSVRGYTLREDEGSPPPVGSELAGADGPLVVTKIGPSPFPGDQRPCAYTAPA